MDSTDHPLLVQLDARVIEVLDAIASSADTQRLVVRSLSAVRLATQLRDTPGVREVVVLDESEVESRTRIPRVFSHENGLLVDRGPDYRDDVLRVIDDAGRERIVWMPETIRVEDELIVYTDSRHAVAWGLEDEIRHKHDILAICLFDLTGTWSFAFLHRDHVPSARVPLVYSPESAGQWSSDVPI